MPSADNILNSIRNDVGEGASRIMPKSTYSATIFDSKKYNVRGYAYPSNLMDSFEYGGNRVIFYINVSTDSRTFKSGGQDSVQSYDIVQKDFIPKISGQSISNAQAATASGIKGAVGGLIGGSLTVSRGAEGAIAGSILGAGGSALIASGSSAEAAFTRPKRQLAAAIALYVPNQLSVRYSAGWSEEDTAQFSAAAAAVGEVSAEIERFISSKGSERRTGGIATDILTSGALGGFGASPVPFATELGIAAGLAANPKKEQAFKNVDFRTFSFDYQFSPKSPEEAQNVLNIIKAFKYHMHPEFKSPSEFVYIYPSEFDIVYYKGTTENLQLHRHTSCVLTEMNVNYTPNGVFSTFPDGTPTQINITLTFKELMLLTKEAIERNA